MHAYCYASGLIEFGRTVPDGAIRIATGPAKTVRDYISPLARHGYRTRKRRGRLEKVPGTDCLLVPGIPEQQGDQIKAVLVLAAWLDWVAGHAPHNVDVARSAVGL